MKNTIEKLGINLEHFNLRTLQSYLDLMTIDQLEWLKNSIQNKNYYCGQTLLFVTDFLNVNYPDKHSFVEELVNEKLADIRKILDKIGRYN